MSTRPRPLPTGRLALLALLLPGTLLAARTAQADVLIEGYKGVSHELRLEGLEQHPELVFVLHPLMFGRGAAYVSSDQPLPYIKLASPRLYALPRDGAPSAKDVRDVDEAWLKARAVAVSWHTFSQLNQLPDDRPEDRVRTVFRLARIEGRKLVIEGVREELFDRQGKLLARRVPAVDESDPDARDDDRPVAPPRDRRGSWAPGRLGDGLFALPAVALLGLLGASWRRRGGPGLRALTVALALGLGGAAIARADVPVNPPSRRVPTWVVAGAAAGAALLALTVIVVVRRRGAAK